MTEYKQFTPIELHQLTAGYDGMTVLNDVSFTLPATGCVVLQGPSGCGKTTLLRVLAGLLKPQSGMITGLEERRISFVFQEDRLLPWCTAKENIALVSDETTADGLLAAVDLSDAAHELPAALSGGMRRRVAIARALSYAQDVLLLDEPFNGLDQHLRSEMAQLIQSHAKLIILVTHDREDIGLFEHPYILRFRSDGKIDTIVPNAGQ